MVRMAVEADVPRILRIIRNFHTAGGFDFAFDAARLNAFVRGIIAADNGAVFVTGESIVGVLIATHDESPMAPVRCAQEHLVWIEPSARGRAWAGLVDAFEAWARNAGCQSVKLFSQSHMRGDTVGRLFRRRGFLPLETAYSKVL